MVSPLILNLAPITPPPSPLTTFEIEPTASDLGNWGDLRGRSCCIQGHPVSIDVQTREKTDGKVQALSLGGRNQVPKFSVLPPLKHFFTLSAEKGLVVQTQHLGAHTQLPPPQDTYLEAYSSKAASCSPQRQLPARTSAPSAAWSSRGQESRVQCSNCKKSFCSRLCLKSTEHGYGACGSW